MTSNQWLPATVLVFLALGAGCCGMAGHRDRPAAREVRAAPGQDVQPQPQPQPAERADEDPTAAEPGLERMPFEDPPLLRRSGTGAAPPDAPPPTDGSAPDEIDEDEGDFGGDRPGRLPDRSGGGTRLQGGDGRGDDGP